MHNKVEQALIEQDALAILNLLNYDMTDQFAALGINTTGGEFVYMEEVDLERVKMRAELLEKAVNVFNLPIGDDYLYEQLYVECPDNYEQLKAEMEEKKKAENPFTNALIPILLLGGGGVPAGGGGSETPQNRTRSFFADAPHSDGALDW